MDASTPIQEQIWFNKPVIYKGVAKNVDLLVHVTGEQSATYQFISSNRKPSDPPVETNLDYGYDAIDDVYGWFFKDIYSRKYFLTQFEPA